MKNLMNETIYSNITLNLTKKAQGIIAQYVDHNEGYPRQKNRGHYYRYTITFINGETFESNSKADIAHYISSMTADELETISKEAQAEQ